MINAPMQPISRFLSFTVEEQRGGTTCTISYFVTETTAHIFIRLKGQRESRLELEQRAVYILNIQLQKQRSNPKIDCVEGISKYFLTTQN